MNDKIKMIKTLISLAKIDSNLDSKAVKLIKGIIDKHSFTPLEKESLLKELEYPSNDPFILFSSIKSYFIRSQIIDISRTLFHIDNNFSNTDKEAYQKLGQLQQNLSKDDIKLEKELAQNIIKDSKSKQLYKDLKDLGTCLANKDTPQYQLRLYHSLFLSKLLQGGKYSQKLALLLIFILLLFISYRYFY